MKKLTIILTLAVAAAAAFAATEKFISWQISDAAVIKAQLAKPDTAVPAYQKVWYAYLLARAEAPESVSTLAKCEKVFDDTKAKYGSTVATPVAILTVMRNCKDARFYGDFAKDAKYSATDYYRQFYVLPGLIPASASERRDIALEVAEKYIKRNQAAQAVPVIDKYVELSLEDDDAVVIKGLQKLYRLAAPKLTAAANDPWKPVVAKLQLALKSRGAEVK